MKTHFCIFILAATLSIPVLTAILFSGFQAHTDRDITFRLLIKVQSILLILCLAILFGVLSAILFMHYWLKPLNMLEQDIATIASNPDQLLPRPQKVAYPCLFWMPNISCAACIKRCANPFASVRGWQMPARQSPKSTMICAICCLLSCW